MKYIARLISFIAVLFAPVLTLASSHSAAQQNAANQAASFVETFNRVILFPLIALLSAVAFLVFLWGCGQYLINATNEQSRQQGVKHITFGIIGLVIMLSAFAILSLAAATFGLSSELECADDPNSGNCQDVFVVPDPVVLPPGGGDDPIVLPPGGGDEPAVIPTTDR